MNSLPDGESFAGFMRASLEHMKLECPAAYARLCELLEGRQVHLSVDGEDVCLHFQAEEISVLPEAPLDPLATALATALATMTVSRRTILDLVDGLLSLQDGIIEGRVGVQGGIAELLLFHEGWLTYLRGAARCPSFPYLLERFRYATETIES